MALDSDESADESRPFGGGGVSLDSDESADEELRVHGTVAEAIATIETTKVSFLLRTVTFHANRAHNLTRSP